MKNHNDIMCLVNQHKLH